MILEKGFVDEKTTAHTHKDKAQLEMTPLFSSTIMVGSFFVVLFVVFTNKTKLVHFAFVPDFKIFFCILTCDVFSR